MIFLSNLGYYDFVIHHDYIPYELTLANPSTNYYYYRRRETILDTP